MDFHQRTSKEIRRRQYALGVRTSSRSSSKSPLRNPMSMTANDFHDFKSSTKTESQLDVVDELCASSNKLNKTTSDLGNSQRKNSGINQSSASNQHKTSIAPDPLWKSNVTLLKASHVHPWNSTLSMSSQNSEKG